MADLKIRIEERAEIGKNFVDKMRDNKIIPGVVYSRGGETVHVAVEASELARIYKVAGSSALIDLTLGEKEIPAIIKDIQRHPYKNEMLHVDFQKINMDEKIKVTIPVVLVNRDNIKAQPSILMQLLDEIDIECLPGNIPQSIEVDVEDMEIDTSIAIADLDIAKDENITIFRELDEVVCTLSAPNVSKEADEEESTEEDAEVEENKEEQE